MSRITGQQARELLDGIIPGPWVAYHDVDARGDDPVSTIESHHHYDSPLAVVDGDGVSTPENARLIAYAPALAETVAWLYGAEMITDPWGDVVWHRHGADGNLTLETDRYVEVETFLSNGNRPLVCVTTGPYGETVHLNADEAVEMARALLAAAEEVRDGHVA